MRRWVGLLSGQSLSFFKEIPPFAKITVTTQVVHWDRRFCFIEHQFIHKGEVHASALARVVFISGKRVKSFEKFVESIQPDIAPLEARQASEKVIALQTLLEKKRENKID